MRIEITDVGKSSYWDSFTHLPVAFIVRSTFWRHLWSVTEKMHGNMNLFVKYVTFAYSFYITHPVQGR